MTDEITPQIAADAVKGEEKEPEKDFQMTPVESSNIAFMGYHQESNTAKVVFKDRKTGNPTSTYEYYNVSPEKFEKWRAADSIGGFHGSDIKGHHDYRKVS